MIAGLFLAEGGHVTGPGSATSDSIPAMLSNGEFVINAANTRKWRPVLEAINAGEIPRFAMGGYVGGGNITTPTASSKGDTQVFNIKITGDISRQTRREVMTMIPELASGVNAHNREQGIKSR
jgi:hypothetical protein